MEGYPPPPTSKESLIKRYKPIWRILLISNLALGAYMFAMARKKNLNTGENKPAKKRVDESKATEEASVEPSIIPSVPETTPPLRQPPVVKVREPIPDDQQREVFQWILEEKRKVKPKDQKEKKRIDEEKAILKQFIRAECIPRF